MLDVLDQDFVRTAKAKGLSNRKVVYGGGVMKQLQLFEMIKTHTSKLLNCFVPLPQIVPSKLGDYSGVTGALKIAHSLIKFQSDDTINFLVISSTFPLVSVAVIFIVYSPAFNPSCL